MSITTLISVVINIVWYINLAYFLSNFAREPHARSPRTFRGKTHHNLVPLVPLLPLLPSFKPCPIKLIQCMRGVQKRYNRVQRGHNRGTNGAGRVQEIQIIQHFSRGVGGWKEILFIYTYLLVTPPSPIAMKEAACSSVYSQSLHRSDHNVQQL